MNANEYQTKAATTLATKLDHKIPPHQQGFLISALWLAVYAGVVVERCKKGILHNHGFKPREILAAVSQVASRANLFDVVPAELSDRQLMALWGVVGLIGEAAEIAHLLLSSVTTGEVNRDKLSLELGDAQFYVAAICTHFGLSLAEVMQENNEKLALRYKDGFSTAASVARVDVK